jgi:hypothetical protein
VLQKGQDDLGLQHGEVRDVEMTPKKKFAWVLRKDQDQDQNLDS